MEDRHPCPVFIYRPGLAVIPGGGVPCSWSVPTSHHENRRGSRPVSRHHLRPPSSWKKAMRVHWSNEGTGTSTSCGCGGCSGCGADARLMTCVFPYWGGRTPGSLTPQRPRHPEPSMTKNSSSSRAEKWALTSMRAECERCSKMLLKSPSSHHPDLVADPNRGSSRKRVKCVQIAP